MAGKSLISRITDRLLRKSAYLRPPTSTSIALHNPDIERIREALGGHLANRPYQVVRWMMGDREAAIHAADAGDLESAAQLYRATMTDGVFAGALNTRIAGTVSLPKIWHGNSDMVRDLEIGHESTRSVFDEMLPPNELSAILTDRIVLGVGVGELCPVVGREYPVLRRLDPMFLRYRWSEGRWYYNSNAGPIPIVPGDGHWCLLTAGTAAPWQLGIWQYAGYAYIRKLHATMMGMAFERTLANPARVATAPLGADEQDRRAWFDLVAAWGVDTIFMGLPGYEVKLLESGGTGWQVFQKTVASCNEELLLAANGQTVTATGGSGFVSGDLFKSVRQELIKDSADDLAYFINTQCLPQWTARLYGPDAIDYGPCVEYDSRPPKDVTAMANSLMQAGSALNQLADVAQRYGLEVDIREAISRFGLPLKLPSSAPVIEYDIPLEGMSDD